MITTTFYTPVQELIHQVEDRMRQQSRGHHSELKAALDHLLSSGGKRIRPAVALLTGGMLGGDTDQLITLSAAIELLHTATLVHDDLIDGSLLRRGLPTINSHWSPAATVLTGDFIFACAAKLASDTGSVAVMRLFAETLMTIVNGEITQLFDRRGITSREHYFRRIQAKTASLFELATGAAALLSPVGEQEREAVCHYGHGIGIAFQIVDDVLDFTGAQSTIGKPVASDLRQGLVTLPTLCYMEAHPEDPDLVSILEGNYYSEERLNRLVDAIRDSGAIDCAMKEAHQFVERALVALEGLPEGVEHQSLVDLAQYIVQRQQ